MVLHVYKCLTSPQKTISALRPPQHEPTRWDKQEVIKTWYHKKKQNIYPLEYHRNPLHTTSTIHTNHARHLGQHFNHDTDITRSKNISTQTVTKNSNNSVLFLLFQSMQLFNSPSHVNIK